MRDQSPQQGRWNRSLCEAFTRENCNLANRPEYWLCSGMLPFMRAVLTARRSAAPNLSGLSVDAAPHFGSLALRAGFGSHPVTRPVEAGGNVKVPAGLGAGCAGFVSAAPDLVLDYSAGRSMLVVSARSTEDVTFVIMQPDGQWACSDDAEGTDPRIGMRTPASGRYRIWIGAFKASGSHPAAEVTFGEHFPRGR